MGSAICAAMVAVVLVGCSAGDDRDLATAPEPASNETGSQPTEASFDNTLAVASSPAVEIPATVGIDIVPITIVGATTWATDEAPAIVVRTPHSNSRLVPYVGCWEWLCVEAEHITSSPYLGDVGDSIMIEFPLDDWVFRARIAAADGWEPGRGVSTELVPVEPSRWVLDVSQHSGRLAIELSGAAPNDDGSALTYVFTIDAP